MYFAAVAGLQGTTQNLLSHPHAGEINRIANLPSSGYDAAVEYNNNLRDKPSNLLETTIHCSDMSGVVEYFVADCGTSVFSGDYFVLEDRKKHVTAEELHRVRVN
ncbi:hypothetical protein PILCRDRAFT_810916 [Piloderma croceum F 1598]|uniref:Uncharacterized protein n=1 Tax=Piloderma croceum (strain F 1598) TaxID=765440 RepID=A0A0C3GM99_PILCF|nr:hypothetical protein PILCRDRAFT_810916 [Piloderma croceum F 1598]